MLAVETVVGTDAVPYWRPLAPLVSDGPDVEALKTYLEAAGYDPGTVDGRFTDRTRAAIEAWQDDHGYPVDGVFLPTDVAPGRSPATVGRVDVAAGDTVAVGQPLVALVEDEATVTVDIDNTDRSRLTLDLPAEIPIPATGATGTGRLVELAEAATVDAQGVERYRGEVALDGDLGAVEGTAVRIEVIRERVDDALAVPVASVSLGPGGEEVRILARDGTIKRVPVQTGLTEGAMVEIVSGLDGSEQVVVEVRQS
ncbi:MAG: peptidoglycan-binding protein [Acidimicrobiales bacterium]